MDWITTKEAAKKWGLTIRRVQVLCDKGKVPSATKLGDVWAIPKDAKKPLDGRTKTAKAKAAGTGKKSGGEAGFAVGKTTEAHKKD